MRGTLLLCGLTLLCGSLFAQTPPVIWKIPADTVLLSYCDSTELVIENHTQNVPGFLFNTGNGRTIFKRGAQKLNDSMYLVGADTVKIPQQLTNYWSLTGNASTTPSQYLGTNDNEPLKFATNGFERMRLFEGGQLGINVQSTGLLASDYFYKLQVNGGIWATGPLLNLGNFIIGNGQDVGGIGEGVKAYPGDAPLYFEGSTSGVVPDMFIFTSYNSTVSRNLTSAGGNIIRIASGFGHANVGDLYGNALNINPTYDYDVTSAPINVRGIYYDPVIGNMMGARHIAIETVTGDVLVGTTSGNMGLGTNLPTAQLHTTGTVRFAGLTPDSTKIRVLVADDSGYLYYRDASTLAANDLIRSSLAVNGSITARRLTLQANNWPDYVFDSSYCLLPIRELKEYIRRNNHLPGVTPAAATENKGVDVGETQAALLKKIEELTLYTIKQDEKMEAMEKEMAELRKMIKESAHRQ